MDHTNKIRSLSAQELLVFNLEHNKLTAGGCLPGISARLVQPYAAFIVHLLEYRRNRLKEQQQVRRSAPVRPAPQNVPAQPVVQKDDQSYEQMLAQAIQNSLVDQAEPTEDELLRQAMLLSLANRPAAERQAQQDPELMLALQMSLAYKC